MTLFGYVLEIQELVTLAFIGMLVGMSKGGVHGAGMIAVPLLATIFGGKNSSGIMLPLLIMADVFGVSYYHRHAQRLHLRKLLPYALVGIILGTLTGDYINDATFKLIMAVIIFVSLGIMFIWKVRNPKIFQLIELLPYQQALLGVSLPWSVIWLVPSWRFTY